MADLYAYVLVPNLITDAMVTQMPVSQEDDTQPWTAKAYVSGEEVHRVETHRVYRRYTDGTDAAGQFPENFPERWQDRRSTNRWAVLDSEAATATRAPGPFSIIVRPGSFNGIYITGVENASGVDITIRDAPGGNIIKQVTDSMEGSEPGDWWEYFEMPFKPRRDLVVSGIEPYITAEATITFSWTGNIGVGLIQYGDLRPIGITEDKAQGIPVDYSFVEVNEDGVNTVRKGKKARDLQFQTYGPEFEANSILATIEEVQGVPCGWFANVEPQFEALRTMGLGKGVLSHENNEYVLSVTVKGLI